MSSPKRRAAQRRANPDRWPVLKFQLGEEPLQEQRDTRSVEERMQAVWFLSIEHWTLAGKKLPSCARAELPGRVIRDGFP